MNVLLITSDQQRWDTLGCAGNDHVTTPHIDGLARDGHLATADRIVADSLKLIDVGGFSEYFDPFTGAPCGGPEFTWTAAMMLEFLKRTDDG